MAQTISPTYAAQLSNDLRDARGYVYSITDNLYIYDDTHLIEYKIQTQSQRENIIFGNTICKYAEIKIQNPNNNTYTFVAGDRFEIFTGLTLNIGEITETVEYISQGIYRVLNIREDKDNQSLILECYDAMVRFNVNYVEASTYPMTLAQFVSYLAISVGLELGSTSFPNASFSLTEQPNVAANEYTARSLLGWAAELAGSNAVIGVDNKVYIREFGTSSVLTITPDLYVNAKIAPLYGPINSVTMVREALSDAVYYPDPLPADSISYRISDNMIAYNQRADIITTIYNEVNGLQYYPFTVDMTGKGVGYIEPFDKIVIEDTLTNTYTTYVMNRTLVFNGALSEVLTAYAYTPTASAVKAPGTISNRVKYTEARVDKVEGDITLITGEVNGLNSSFAQLVLDVDSVTTTVSETIEGLGTLSTEVQQLTDSYNITVANVDEIKTYYQYTADSLTIGKSSSPAQITIGYDALSKPQMILDDGSNNTAVIKSDLMTINNAKIASSMEMGNHKIQKLTGSTTVTIFLPI